MKMIGDVLKDTSPNKVKRWKQCGDDLLLKWNIDIPQPLTASNPKIVDKSVAIANHGTRLTFKSVILRPKKKKERNSLLVHLQILKNQIRDQIVCREVNSR